MAKLNVEVLDRSAWRVWDNFVARHPSGTVCHRTEWLSRVGDGLQVFVVADGGGSVQGGVALVRTAKHGVRGFHVPPYTPYFGPLVHPSEKKGIAARRSAEHKILRTLLGSLPKAAHVDFRLPPGLDDLYPYYRHGFSLGVVFTHEICGGVRRYAENVSERRRAYLRRLESFVAEGKLVVEVGMEPEPVIQLWEDAAQRKGVAAKIDVLRRLAGHPAASWEWTVVCIKDVDGNPLSGVVLPVDDRRALNLVNATAEQIPKGLEQVNLLATDTAIRHVLAEDLIFDFEGSMLPGVEEFYRLLGGTSRPTFRLQRSRSPLYFGMRLGAQFLAEWKGRRR